MASNGYKELDLASVLKTLANLAPQSQHHASQSVASPPPQEVNPRDPRLQSGPFETQYSQQQIISQPQHPATKKIDPTTITDWSTGLRCVMKTVATNDSIVKEIQRMIKIQHEHEDQWWAGRQALLEKQEARKEGQKKLDEVLKAVGGKTSLLPSGTNGKTPAEEAADELKTFDMKVYRAQLQMVKEMSAKLKNLGIPFFGTRTELVRVPAKEGKLVAAKGAVVIGDADDGGKIEEKDLVALQKKMLAILEDLCQAPE